MRIKEAEDLGCMALTEILLAAMQCQLEQGKMYGVVLDESDLPLIRRGVDLLADDGSLLQYTPLLRKAKICPVTK